MENEVHNKLKETANEAKEMENRKEKYMRGNEEDRE